jgi:glucose/arabinose dehydrogenase
MGRRVPILALVLLAFVPPAARAGTPPVGFSDNAVATGLTSPVAIAILPGPSRRILVAEKGGALKLVNGGTITTLTTIPVCTASEMGLLGVAPDPNFSTNGFVYLFRTKPPDPPADCSTSTGRFNQVVRVTMSGNTVVPGSLTELLTGIRTDTGAHDAGGLRIGTDNKLYVSVGDTAVGDMGGPGESTNPYSQDLGSLNGKVLRLELTGAPAAGNPFIGTPGARGEIYAYGFRNPFRFGIDPVTGKPWLGDVGQSTLEELDLVQSGGNYSWPYCEGNLPAGCEHPGDIDPFFPYPRSGPGVSGTTVIGGAFSPKSAGFGPYGDNYFFADYGVSKIWRGVPNAARDGFAGTPADFITGAGNPVDIVFDNYGAMYYVSIGAGEVRKVVPDYPRPKAASPIRASLVPAYQPCSSPNRTHGPPLGFGSCNPPVQQSGFLTVGTADANGQVTNSVGFIRLTAITGDPGTPADEADMAMRVDMTDVRRKSDLADYTGQLQGRLPIRITDKNNPPSSGGSSAGTTTDNAFTFTIPCTTTGSLNIGSDCAVTTTADAVMAGAVKEGVRSVWQLGQIEVLDGGPDGVASTADNTVFARQGVFVP